MGGIPQVASIVLSNASRSIDVSAQNIANMTTSGYKRRVAFSRILEGANPAGGVPDLSSSTDFSSGKLVETGRPYDLAVLGDGFFVVRTVSQKLLYTREGQFSRDAEGRLATAGGLVLQAEGGGDILVRGDEISIGADGAVLEAGRPIGRVAVVALPASAERAEGGAFAAAAGEVQPLSAPVIRQGAYEASNVTTADEMVAMMAALRRAETGQRLMTLYDDLMGRALTTFGQS